MSEINELKEIVLELAQRVSTLETLMRSTPLDTLKTKSSISRVEEPINKLVILGREKDKCLCGIQSSKGDKTIPIIELNMLNLKALMTNIDEVLRSGNETIKLENYKQHTQYASYRRGSWDIST